MLLINRIKEWVTTVLGLVLLAGAGYLLFLGKITAGEFLAFLPVCIGLFWAKNSFITDMLKPGKGTAAVLLLLMLTSTACHTSRTIATPPSVTSSSSINNISDGGETQQGYTKPDSSSIKALLYCDSLGNVQMKYIAELLMGNAVKPKVSIKDNYIYLQCKIDSAQVYNKYSRFYRSKTDTVTQTEYLPGVTTNELTWAQSTMVKLGWLFIASVILFILYIVYKRKF